MRVLHNIRQHDAAMTKRGTIAMLGLLFVSTVIGIIVNFGEKCDDNGALDCTWKELDGVPQCYVDARFDGKRSQMACEAQNVGVWTTYFLMVATFLAFGAYRLKHVELPPETFTV